MSISQTEAQGPIAPERAMIAGHRRLARRAGLIIATGFVVYHVIAMAFVGPGAESHVRSKLLPYFDTYISTLKLAGGWSFYAPNPPAGTIISYEVVGAGGERAVYPLSHARDKLERGYFLYTNFFNYVLADPVDAARRGHVASMVRYLCARPGGFPANEITFIEQTQKAFRHTDFLDGKRPLDAEFLNETRHGPHACGE